MYRSAGIVIETITVADLTNLCFDGTEGQTLRITAKTAFSSVRVRAKGVSSSTKAGDMNSDGRVDLRNAISGSQVVVREERNHA